MTTTCKLSHCVGLLNLKFYGENSMSFYNQWLWIKGVKLHFVRMEIFSIDKEINTLVKDLKGLSWWSFTDKYRIKNSIKELDTKKKELDNKMDLLIEELYEEAIVFLSKNGFDLISISDGDEVWKRSE